MLYFKSSQPVPGKGNACTYYECDEGSTVRRYVTHLTESDEIERVTDPVVKKLYRPDLLEPATKEEFEQYWGT